MARRYRRKSRRFYRRYKGAKRWEAFMDHLAANPAQRRIIFGPNRRQMMENPALIGTLTPDQIMNRRITGYRGEGDYRDWARWIPRGIGGALGAGLGWTSGGLEGAWAGGKQGWNTGARISKMFGWGDYAAPVSGNQIITAPPPPDAATPVFVNASDATGDVWISHREFVSNVVVKVDEGLATSKFDTKKFPLNPGLKATFPWLSSIAANFELYDFEGLLFQYVPNYGEGNSNMLGKIIMATNYDPNAGDFTTAIQMQNYDYSNSCKPSVGMVHGVETHNSAQVVNNMYIRTEEVTRDKTFTDLGNFYIGYEGIPTASGMPAGTGGEEVIIGELWITYRIKLSRAVLFSNILSPIEGLVEIATNVTGGNAPTTDTTDLWPVGTEVREAYSQNNWVVESGSPGNPGRHLTISSNKLTSGTFSIRVHYEDSAALNTTWEDLTAITAEASAIMNPQWLNGSVYADYVESNKPNVIGGKAVLQAYFTVTAANPRLVVRFKNGEAPKQQASISVHILRVTSDLNEDTIGVP